MHVDPKLTEKLEETDNALADALAMMTSIFTTIELPDGNDARSQLIFDLGRVAGSAARVRSLALDAASILIGEDPRP